jgi:hypothetical protein
LTGAEFYNIIKSEKPLAGSDGMKDEQTANRDNNRKLGDEWWDWDGHRESAESDYRVFLGLAILSTLLLITCASLFLWLIFPRLTSAGDFVSSFFTAIFLVFGVILLLWLLLFVSAAVTRRPITKLIIIPQMVNRLLSLVMIVGRILGIPKDRLTNSFLKIHNMILGSRPPKTEPERLLVLLPRCLTAENFRHLRALRDRYHFQLATVGGGSEARRKIMEIKPGIIIAIACERDLLSGFRDINTHIPVIGFPNRRPEGPCKNTCVDLAQIEGAIRNCLIFVN